MVVTRSLSADAPAGDSSVAARRLRAFMRRAGQGLQRLIGRRPVEGFVDRVLAGEVRGWALDPNRPGRRVHVVARSEGRVVAEALADLPRRDLMADGRGDGRCAFALRLPAALLDGAPRRVRVEAVTGLWRTRLVGGELRLGGEDASKAHRASGPDGDPDTALSSPAWATAEACAALLVWGEASEDEVSATLATWSAQDWPRTSVMRLSEGPGDEDALRRFIGEAHTVVLARAGDQLDPAAARLLVQARPLADVATWDGPGGAGRRPWARALGVLLGETLGGAFAVRGHVLSGVCDTLAVLGRGGDVRALELRLAGQAGLRWTHLPAPLASRSGPIGGWSPIPETSGTGLEGYAWMAPTEGRSGRLAPLREAARISLGVWPALGPDDERTLAALAAAADGAEVEVLVPASAIAGLEDRLRAMVGEDAAARLSARPVDEPRGGGAGRWLRALGQAASGEAVVLLRSGVVPSLPSGALRELAAWTLSPLVGAVSIDIEADGGDRLAGLKLVDGPAGWAAVSAFDPERRGQPRPVLAAPGAFLGVARDKLAALGGFDAHRFPGEGADLDLALRLRDTGAACVLFGDLRASASAPGGELSGTAMAAFDPAGLALSSGPGA